MGKVTVGFDPVLVNFDRQRPDQPQGALLIAKDADDMGAALEPLVDPLKPVRAFEMFAVLSRQTVKGKGFLIIALISALALLLFCRVMVRYAVGCFTLPTPYAPTSLFAILSSDPFCIMRS